MTVSLASCNPFVRAAEYQPSVLEGESLRRAYDHRLFFVLDGTGRLVLEQGDYPIGKGSVLCLPPTVGYCFRGKLHVAVINYDPTRCCEARRKPICPPPLDRFDPDLRFDQSQLEGFCEPCITNGGELLFSEIADIVTAFHRRDRYSDALCSSKLKTVLTLLTRQQDPDSSPESLLADKIDGYIRRYATRPCSNRELAEHFGYHPVYLASVYKEQRNKTLHQAVTEERLRIACRWLSQTNASLDEIAAQVGFSSRSHFCTAFKTKLGCSPGEWRRRPSVFL